MASYHSLHYNTCMYGGGVDFWLQVSCIPGWSQTSHVAELWASGSPSPYYLACWNAGSCSGLAGLQVCSHTWFFNIGMEPWALCMLGRHNSCATFPDSYLAFWVFIHLPQSEWRHYMPAALVSSLGFSPEILPSIKAVLGLFAYTFIWVNAHLSKKDQNHPALERGSAVQGSGLPQARSPASSYHAVIMIQGPFLIKVPAEYWGALRTERTLGPFNWT